jgi:hypothetical protein
LSPKQNAIKVYNPLFFKYNHKFVQLTPLSNFRIFSLCQKEALYPLAATLYSLLLQPQATSDLPSASLDLSILDISKK